MPKFASSQKDESRV